MSAYVDDAHEPLPDELRPRASVTIEQIGWRRFLVYGVTPAGAPRNPVYVTRRTQRSAERLARQQLIAWYARQRGANRWVIE